MNKKIETVLTSVNSTDSLLCVYCTCQNDISNYATITFCVNSRYELTPLAIVLTELKYDGIESAWYNFFYFVEDKFSPKQINCVFCHKQLLTMEQLITCGAIFKLSGLKAIENYLLNLVE